VNSVWLGRRQESLAKQQAAAERNGVAEAAPA
jgi:hypothetical protein